MKRARELGIPFDGVPGPNNAITDVNGTLVGQTTLIPERAHCLLAEDRYGLVSQQSCPEAHRAILSSPAGMRLMAVAR